MAHVVRVRRDTAGTDRYGNPTYSETQTVLGGRSVFTPGGSSEPVEVGRERVVSSPKLLFAGSWPDVRADDRLIVDGRTFTVEGRPASLRGPVSDRGGLVVALREVEG